MVRRVAPRVWGTALSGETAMKYPVSRSAVGHTFWGRSLEWDVFVVLIKP